MMRLTTTTALLRSCVGLVVGIAANLVFLRSLSAARIRSLPPTKHLVLLEDEV